jgi:hypothetical protein
MTYKPSDNYFGLITTRRFDTGIVEYADATPVAQATRNGSDDSGFALSVAAIDAGRYKITGTIPANYSPGDVVQIWIAATVNGVTDKAVVDAFVLDGKRIADLHDLDAGAAMTLAASEDIYPADVQFTVDGADSRDEYTVTWYRNGTVLTVGLSAASIEVLKRSDASSLITAGTALAPIGDSGAYKYDESQNRLTPGDAAIVTVTATIDGQARTWRRIVTRDSAAGA